MNILKFRERFVGPLDVKRDRALNSGPDHM